MRGSWPKVIVAAAFAVGGLGGCEREQVVPAVVAFRDDVATGERWIDLRYDGCPGTRDSVRIGVSPKAYMPDSVFSPETLSCLGRLRPGARTDVKIRLYRDVLSKAGEDRRHSVLVVGSCSVGPGGLRSTVGDECPAWW